MEVLTPAPSTPASSLGCSVHSLHHEASSPSIFIKVFFFFFLLMEYEIWLETLSCCLLLTGQIFSAMCGWSFTICLLLKTLFLCLPQVLNSNQAYPLDYFLLVIHDDMANEDWKRYPPQKKIRMRKSRFLGTKNKDARYNCVSLFPVSQKMTLLSHLHEERALLSFPSPVGMSLAAFQDWFPTSFLKRKLFKTRASLAVDQ